MAVENAAHSVRHRLFMVVAIHQHAENAGNGAFLGPGPGALKKARQLGKDGGGIALGGRRLAGRKTDLPLRHGEAGDRVHQHQHILAEIAEIFGDGELEVGGLAAHQRRLVRRGNHHHRPRQAVGAEVVLPEFLHFATVLADKTDDRNVRRYVAGEHRQKHRLADTGARENAHALAAATGDECVERAHPEIERIADAAAGMRRWRRVAIRIGHRPSG